MSTAPHATSPARPAGSSPGASAVGGVGSAGTGAASALGGGRVGVANPLHDRIAALEHEVRTWQTRATAPVSTERWLLEVPDVGPTCETLLADAILRGLDETERAGLLALLRATQDPTTGAWLDAAGQPDVSATCLAWWALVQWGADPEQQALQRALRAVHALGGAQRAGFHVRLWLAMAGAIGWSWLPSMPSELWLLPPANPLSPERTAPWARAMLVPFMVLSRAPARLHLVDPSPLLARRSDGRETAPRLTRPGLPGDLLQAFDRSVQLARKVPRGPLRSLVMQRVEHRVDATQQRHGGWFGARPTLLSLLALRVSGATSDDPRITRGLQYLARARGFTRLPDGRLALAQGLRDRPLRSFARLVSAAPDPTLEQWLLEQEVDHAGPWQRRADAATGGWPVEPGAVDHLDLEATCRTLAALSGVRPEAPRAERTWAAARRATDVLLAMQESDGSFCRFERGETSAPMRNLPWNDADLLAAGERGDEAHVRLTAEVLTRLGHMAFRSDDDRVMRGIRFLERRVPSLLHQASLGTLRTLAETCEQGLPADHGLRRAVERTLRGRQLEDGSFGDTAQTAVALQGLLALQEHPCVQARRAATWLVAHEGTSTDGLLEPGIGLSPVVRDPSAGARESALALRSFAGRGGRLGDADA